MAQLRDRITSELIAEGPPADLLLIARELGPDEVLWDDVGAGFDIAALERNVDEQLEALPADDRGDEEARRQAVIDSEAADAARALGAARELAET